MSEDKRPVDVAVDVEDKRPADVGDMIRFAIVIMQLALNIITVWRENKDSITKGDIKSFQALIDPNRKIF